MSSLKPYLALLALLATLAGLNACSTTSGTNVTTNHLTGESSMIISNSRLDHRLKVTNVKYDTVNEIKRVHITLLSNKNKRYSYHYRIVWFDEFGTVIDPDSKPYRTLILDGHDSTVVSGVANNPSAVSSKIRIREIESTD